MSYVCRGSVNAIKVDGNKVTFFLSAKTQFDPAKNTIKNQKEKYNILREKEGKDPLFKWVAENQPIKVTSNKHDFLQLLHMAYEEEATFEMDEANGTWKLSSLTVGRTDV